MEIDRISAIREGDGWPQAGRMEEKRHQEVTAMARYDIETPDLGYSELDKTCSRVKSMKDETFALRWVENC